MSKTINVSITINKSIDEVWNEVSILKNHTNWMKDAVSIEFLNDKTQGLGAKMKVLTKVGPIKLFDYMTVTEWIDKKSIGVEHIGIILVKVSFTLNEISKEETEFFALYKNYSFFAGPIRQNMLLFSKNNMEK